METNWSGKIKSGEDRSNQNIGVFGGTFDPPHFGHLILAMEALHQFGLDKILFVLSPNPPHKNNDKITALKHRLQMLTFALQDNSFFEISTIDIDRPGPHFAADTMKILNQQYPASKFTFLMGGDSLHDLPNWGTPEVFLSYCHQLGVMGRKGETKNLTKLKEFFPQIDEKVKWLNTPLFEISSRSIRHRMQNNLPFQYFLPSSIYQYILKNNLYQN